MEPRPFRREQELLLCFRRKDRRIPPGQRNRLRIFCDVPIEDSFLHRLLERRNEELSELHHRVMGEWLPHKIHIAELHAASMQEFSCQELLQVLYRDICKIHLTDSGTYDVILDDTPCRFLRVSRLMRHPVCPEPVCDVVLQ